MSGTNAPSGNPMEVLSEFVKKITYGTAATGSSTFGPFGVINRGGGVTNNMNYQTNQSQSGPSMPIPTSSNANNVMSQTVQTQTPPLFSSQAPSNSACNCNGMAMGGHIKKKRRYSGIGGTR